MSWPFSHFFHLCSEEATAEPLLVVTAHMPEKNDPIMKYLNACSATKANKIVMDWKSITNEHGVDMTHKIEPIQKQLLGLAEALARKWEGRQIVLLVDEILHTVLDKLDEQTFPESVKMILVVNPNTRRPNPPPSFLYVTLTTPYRSTIAITLLARFIAKCKGLYKGLGVLEGECGSDVEGTTPIFLDVGKIKDERKIIEALNHCRKHLGDDVTMIREVFIPPTIEAKAMKAVEPWDCRYNGWNFYGWEVEKAVIVTSCGSDRIMELITRAKTHLAIIFVDHGYGDYERNKKFFQQAADQGLVDIVPLSAS